MPSGTSKTATLDIKTTDAPEPDMRQRVKSLAADLLIKHGYRGVSFGDIAEALSTTRANIHYHFGNKNALVEEVTDEYVSATLARFRAIWTDAGSSLEAKVDATIALNRRRYDAFNVGGDQGQSWSLIARMRADSDALSARGVACVRRFAAELVDAVATGVGHAVRRGELSAATPVEDVVLQLVTIVNCAGPITQDAATFERLEQLYRAFLRTTIAAYGARRRRAPAAAPRGGAKAGPRVAVRPMKSRSTR
jgi:AcrR family transcriptional regulator